MKKPQKKKEIIEITHLTKKMYFCKITKLMVFICSLAYNINPSLPNSILANKRKDLIKIKKNNFFYATNADAVDEALF